MFFLPTLLITFILTLTSISAKIGSITFPDHALPGENITVHVSSHSYIQNWNDYGIIWGLLRDNDEDCETCLGMEVGFENLYGNNTLGNTTYTIQLPNTTAGAYYLKAAVPYLVGASGETGINYFNQSITLVSNAKIRR